MLTHAIGTLAPLFWDILMRFQQTLDLEWQNVLTGERQMMNVWLSVQ